jgi:transposase InsO family protein
LWVADLTYVAIVGGFVYVALIMDAWSRRIVGYAMGADSDASRPGLPRRSRPGFRDEGGHGSDLKAATIPI